MSSICTDWPTYGGGQKSHFNPRMTPDWDWLVIVAGKDSTETNEIYGIDVADLERTWGLE